MPVIIEYNENRLSLYRVMKKALKEVEVTIGKRRQ